jgi:hypothetical protein
MGFCSQNGDFELNITTFRKLSIENSRQHLAQQARSPTHTQRNYSDLPNDRAENPIIYWIFFC